MSYVRHQLGRLCLGLCVLALAPFQVAQAQSTDRITAAEFGRLWGPALDPAGATQVRNYPSGPSYPVTAAPTVTAEAGGGLAVTKSARFPVDPSRVIDVTAKAPITKAAMGKALKGAVALTGGPWGVALFAASEIVDWMNQSGLRQSPTSPGVIEKLAPGSCTVAPCYAYRHTVWNDGVFYNNPIQAVQVAAQIYMQQNPGYVVTNFYTTGTGTAVSGCWDRTAPAPANGLCYGLSSQSRTPDATASWLTASPTEIESAASVPTMKPEWLRRVLDSGVPVDAGNVTLTGPATASGPSSTSTKQIKDAGGNVTGTQTVTNSTTYNITYAGNTYNVNSVTTTTTVNPDGTSTVETKNEPKPTEKDPPTDCDKYPDSLGCVSLGTPTSDTLNKSTRAVSVVATAFASSSGCPAPLSFAVRGSSYSISYQPICDRLIVLKVLFLAIAGVLAAYILADSFRVQ